VIEPGVPELVPYPLAQPIRDRLTALAAESDILLVGEVHGTREVPRVVLSLLPDLTRLGYGALALEIPSDSRYWLSLRGLKRLSWTPRFFEHPSDDGRGNVQLLALIEEVMSFPEGGWQLLCFDVARLASPPEGANYWSWRDATMARNLLAQRSQFCPNRKVIGICGNMHSRLANHAPEGNWMHDCWPSLAAQLQEMAPHLAIRTINTHFATGTFYNMGVKSFTGEPIEVAKIYLPENGEHTLELALPYATAVSFLREPE
jgi:hypothetical protein